MFLYALKPTGECCVLTMVILLLVGRAETGEDIPILPIETIVSAVDLFTIEPRLLLAGKLCWTVF